MNMKLTTEEMIDRWEDQRKIKNLMGIYINHIILNMDEQVYENLWADKEDVCYGENEGWYIGPDAVKGFYAATVERNKLVAKLLQKRFSDEIGDKTDEEIFGIGTFRDYPVASPVIEVAGDGQTAKGLWQCWGSHAEITQSGPHANWTFGFFAADFIREGDDWKIWHLQFTNDIDRRCGSDWGVPAEELEEVADFAELKDFKMPEYTKKELLREPYSAKRALTPSPQIPQPYETFADTTSYGAAI